MCQIIMLGRRHGQNKDDCCRARAGRSGGHSSAKQIVGALLGRPVTRGTYPICLTLDIANTLGSCVEALQWQFTRLQGRIRTYWC